MAARGGRAWERHQRRGLAQNAEIEPADHTLVARGKVRARVTVSSDPRRGTEQVLEHALSLSAGVDGYTPRWSSTQRRPGAGGRSTRPSFRYCGGCTSTSSISKISVAFGGITP